MDWGLSSSLFSLDLHGSPLEKFPSSPGDLTPVTPPTPTLEGTYLVGERIVLIIAKCSKTSHPEVPEGASRNDSQAMDTHLQVSS